MKRLREQRKREQESNVTRKKKEKELHKQRSLAGQQEVSVSDQSDSDNSDEEWYREEVGEAPDPGLMTLLINNVNVITCSPLQLCLEAQSSPRSIMLVQYTPCLEQRG